jgi:hypothetical protein
MNQMVKRIIILLGLFLLLGGCAELLQHRAEPERVEPESLPKADFTNHILSCLNDTYDIGPEEFAAKFETAEERLQYGRDQDKLRFICLSLHPKAEYKQLKQGTIVLEQYIAKNPDSAGDIQGLQVLLDRLDMEIKTKWSAWKSLQKDNEALTTEVKSLQEKHDKDQVLIEELHKQIEQLKNIENIIKSRETEQP